MTDENETYPSGWTRVEIRSDRAIVTCRAGKHSAEGLRRRVQSVLNLAEVKAGCCSSGFVPPSFVYHVSLSGTAVFNYIGKPRNAMAEARSPDVHRKAKLAARLGRPAPPEAVCVVFPLYRTDSNGVQIVGAEAYSQERQAVMDTARSVTKAIEVESDRVFEHATPPYAVGDEVEWRVAPGSLWQAGRISSIIDVRLDDDIDKPCWSACVDTAPGRKFLGPVLAACVRPHRNDTPAPVKRARQAAKMQNFGNPPPAPPPQRIDGLTPHQCFQAFQAAQRDAWTFVLELPVCEAVRGPCELWCDTEYRRVQHVTDTGSDGLVVNFAGGSRARYPRNVLRLVRRSTALTPAQRDAAREIWARMLRHDVGVSKARDAEQASSVTIANEDLEIEALAGDAE